MTTLDQLAHRCGIQDTVPDASGNEVEITPALKRTLLTAMHFNVETEEQTQTSLDQLDSKEWERALPPVTVAYAQGQSFSVPVTLPAETGNISWTLTLEDGAERSRHASFKDLALLDEQTRGGRRLQRRSLLLDANLPFGYHSLKLDVESAAMALIVTPGVCWLPDTSEDARFWGVAAELFVVRSKRNWGIGDYTDLRELVTLTAERGADVVGLNPLHAMFLDDPEAASPYSPSDRILLNILNIDVEAIPECATSERAQKLIAGEDFHRRLTAVRNATCVQYEKAAELKLAVLRILFAEFEERNEPDRMQQFEAFHAERRDLLDRACLFQAMRAYFASQSPSLNDCHDWPEEYRSSLSPAVQEFAARNARLVRFHLWLQWIADSQLKAASEQAGDMAIGLYRDLAVGAHPSGAEVWSQPDQLVSDVSVGAPPDELGPNGQNWGLPPLHPLSSREHAYSSFINLLRANMRYAGGLRIDHVMALRRLYWIPKGSDGKNGAYVHYPMEDLIGIVALESHRHQCLVVGEDLGTVPDGFRERMAQANILSYRVLFFEKEEQAFLPPEEYPRLALSVAANHDLPTVRGWWQGSDIDLKERLGLYSDGADAARKEREHDRHSLVALFQEQDLIPRRRTPNVEEFTAAAHAFIARTRSLLTIVQLDDITGEEEQVNVPGTMDENPNWRRRLSATLEELSNDPRLDTLIEAMTQGRMNVPEYQTT